MSEKEILEFIELVEKKTDEICKTEESAKQYLVDVGINNSDGSLTPEYLPS